VITFRPPQGIRPTKVFSSFFLNMRKLHQISVDFKQFLGGRVINAYFACTSYRSDQMRGTICTQENFPQKEIFVKCVIGGRLKFSVGKKILKLKIFNF
jgi:hypothetical protein